ncbi:MAG: ABC transporter permease [Planctomycetes bacterium]|nr:ABC transporter permease [Planctomycetota bacterium]
MRNVLTEYGMLLVLLLLVVCFSALTVTDTQNSGAAAGRELAETIEEAGAAQRVAVITRETVTGTQLADALQQAVATSSLTHEVVGVVHGEPPDVRRQLDQWNADGVVIDVIACPNAVASWQLLGEVNRRFPGLGGGCRVISPASYRWPAFLKAQNVLNIAQQISIIAIIAIGMTLVIITAGIDLSVGSLIGLAAVTATVLIRDAAGAREAGTGAMILCGLAGVLACGLCGFVSGCCVAAFRIPAFIVTLAMMLMARGLALTITDSQSVNQVPEAFGWLGSERSLGVPNSVILMFVLYAGAHFVMSRTRLGRHVYAIGGNAEAARLAGVPVQRVQLTVYTLCGLLAGLGGVIMASKHKGVEPNFGFMDELTVIAAVVVGGTSLMGGQGKVLGTLIGAFIIAVIRNGMNQVGVPPNPQMMAMGAVILLAVLIDQIRKGNVSLRDIRQTFRS